MCEINQCNSCKSDCNDQLPLITSAFLTLTESCPLKCEYCFVKQNPQHMTLDIAKRSAVFLIENALRQKDIPSINFFGGEPMVKWDEIIVPITKYIREDLNVPFKLSMTTNGVLLNRERLEFMKRNDFGLLFSIDGDRDTTAINRPLHNGKNSFDILENIIPLVLEYYPNMTFRATISNKTVGYTFHNMKFADECGYKNMFFVPNAFIEWTDEQKDELNKQMRLFSNWYIENARKGKLIKLSPFEDKIKKIKLINEETKNNRFRVESANKIGQGKCGLGANKFGSIGTDGKIFGCQEMVSNVGDIFEIGDIYNGTDNNKRLILANTFNKVNVKGLSCENCKLNNVCDGGCVANNFMINGDVNKPSKMWCYWEQLLLDEAIYVCNVLGNEKNELFKNTYFN